LLVTQSIRIAFAKEEEKEEEEEKKKNKKKNEEILQAAVPLRAWEMMTLWAMIKRNIKLALYVNVGDPDDRLLTAAMPYAKLLDDCLLLQSQP